MKYIQANIVGIDLFSNPFNQSSSRLDIGLYREHTPENTQYENYIINLRKSIPEVDQFPLNEGFIIFHEKKMITILINATMQIKSNN